MQFKAKDLTFKFETPETVDTDLLEVFPYEYKGSDIGIATVTDEFTSVCPFSGLPDFAKIRIEYVPNEKVIELRSMKYYLMSFRNVGIFYEHLVNKILDDLVECCEPKEMSVVLDFTPRGGLSTTVSAKYPR